MNPPPTIEPPAPSCDECGRGNGTSQPKATFNRNGVKQPGGTRDVTVYRRLILDDRISHGAFRLWHYLRDKSNRKGQCWPAQRTIATELHCKPHSLAGWIDELVNSGYLATNPQGQNHHFIYTVLTGCDVLPKAATPGDAQTGNAKEPCCPNGQRRVLPISPTVLPKAAIPRDAQKGNVSNINEVNSISKGEDNPRISVGQQRIEWEGELKRITAALKECGGLNEYSTGSNKYNEVKSDLARREFLLKKLGMVR
jgi:hypothetical protein